MKTPEYYPDKLERECKEMEENHPTIKIIVDGVLKINSMTNMDFDYNIEKKHLMYTGVAKVLQSYMDKELIEFARFIEEKNTNEGNEVLKELGYEPSLKPCNPNELLTQFRNKQQDR